MSYIYRAFVQYKDTAGRLVSLPNTATITAYKPDGTTIASPTFTNLAVGIYRAQVTHTELEPVLFRIVPDIADQADFEDVVVLHDQVIHMFPLIPAAVWANPSRTLTQTAIEILAAITGDSITQIRGNSWEFDIDDLTLDPNLIQFAIKEPSVKTSINQKIVPFRPSNPDADALLFIDTDTGLLRINAKSAPDPALGSLAYAGTTLTVTLAASVTAQLAPGIFTFGIQSIDAGGIVSEIYGGTFVILQDVVRAVA